MNCQIARIQALLFFLLLLSGGCADGIQTQRFVRRRPWKYETDRSDYENVAKIARPSHVSDADLQKINKVAVLVTSADPLFGRIVEDQLSASLRESGFDVVEPLTMYERTLRELRKGELARLREELNAGEETYPDPEGTDRDDAHVIAAAKELGLDALIMGEVDEETRPLTFDKLSTPTTVEKLMVLTFNVDVIDIGTEQNVLSVKLIHKEEENIINSVDNVVKLITFEMGR